MKGKRTLVTGADGFIGSHLTEKLVRNGHDVRAFCYYNSFNSRGWLDTVPKEILSQIEIVMGDIRDPNLVRDSMKGVDIVFHLAALIAIPFSYHSPDSYVDTNVKGTLNVLQGARHHGTARVVVTSTSEVYGTAMYVPIDEKHPRQPQSPYAASKLGADALAESFFRSFEIPVTIARPFNTFGPRQSARAVIPSVIIQLLSGSSEIRLGDVTPTRDLLYVDDTIDGFIAIAETEKLIGEDCNLSSGTEISIKDLANQIISLIKPDARIVVDEERLRPAKSEVFRLCGSSEKIRTYSNWKPNHSVEDGLRKTIQWFSDPQHLKLYKSDIYNV
jgi:NAD dependent epimerase/dehydratase